MKSGVRALAKKELVTFLGQPTLHLLMGLCMGLIGLIFTVSLFTYVKRSLELSAKIQESGLNLHEQLIQGYFGVVHYVFLLLLCFLSTHFFTDEKRQGTLGLLLSSPLTSWDLVLGKFLGGAGFVLFLCSVASLFPLGLAFYVDFQWVPFFIAALGLFLALLVYLSVAMAISALCSSSLLAPFLTFVSLLSLALISAGQYLVEAPEAKSFFAYLSLERHFGAFRVGHLTLGSSLFFIGLCFFFLAVCERVIESHRWS